MKKFTFVLGFLLVSLAGMAQKNVVNVETAGTLQQVLEEQGLTQAEELTITGELNGDDIRVLRSMGGGWFILHSNEWETPPLCCLKRLDLTDARIVEGGYMYARFSMSSSPQSAAYHYTTNDVIGKYMFARMKTLEELKLPSQLKKIDSNAFEGCLLKELDIPEGVKSIENCAFWNMTKLETLHLPSTLTSLSGIAIWVYDLDDYYIFYGDGGPFVLKTLICDAIEPPTVKPAPVYNSEGTEYFFDKLVEQTRLEVPYESIQKYRDHPQWGRFVNISSNKAPTAVNQVERADSAPSAWYSYDGRQLTSPAKGLNIVRMKDGSVRKVMVR